MKSNVIGFPRIGENRELKFNTEKYFKGEINQNELYEVASSIKRISWFKMKIEGIDFIPSNDFSFYDNMLDLAYTLNVIPKKYKDLKLNDLDTYFAMARGYDKDNKSVKALSMKKWFNTNYHYIEPVFETDTKVLLNSTKIFDEYLEALSLDIKTTPTIIGPYTFLKLSKFNTLKNASYFKDDIVKVYIEILNKFNDLKLDYFTFQEPYLVHDTTSSDIDLFKDIYNEILKNKGNIKIILETYFGDIRDSYKDIVNLNFDGLGLDFIEGKETLNLIKTYGFSKDKLLFAGVINGKNIWKNNYENTYKLLDELKEYNVVISTSCSLLHVPYKTSSEDKIKDEYKKYFSFAYEKLHELNEIKNNIGLEKNKELFKNIRPDSINLYVREKIKNIKENDFIRLPAFSVREESQHKFFNLPLLPTTTIGSFPQTKEIRAIRKKYKDNLISSIEYNNFLKDEIKKVIKLQEDLNLDVLVHGEFERNDMVEYFGENLNGFLFTKNAWVQSYGTRCVKPPVIWGDVSRDKSFSVEWIKYAQSLTKHKVKGMLTGPVTIYNWSFPREDLSFKDTIYQIGLAIKDEVLDLEKNGINIIQIDEAALREKLPLRKCDWYKDYLDYAINAFRLTHSKVSINTQIHTHMCYSEFSDIIKAIDDMDADVITFEASRSNYNILKSLKDSNFKTEVGPGVYDIHSPRVPSKNEIKEIINNLLKYIDKSKLWINPDCGLKTRGEKEVYESLKNLVDVTKEIRKDI